MRYDYKIQFVKEGKLTYDASTGDYTEATPSLYEFWANVTFAGESAVKMGYGDIKQGDLVIRIRGKLDADDYDYLLYDGKKYRVQPVRTYRNQQTFLVSEEQVGVPVPKPEPTPTPTPTPEPVSEEVGA